MIAELTPLWRAFNDAAEELNAEAGDVVRLLDRLDDALDARSLFTRVFGTEVVAAQPPP